MALPVTAFFAGLLALWIVFLAFQVVGFRRRARVSLGSGGDADGERLIRAHANATETIPIFLILLALAEGMGTPVALLYVFGMVFTIGRLLHGLHFLKPRKGFTLRISGMILTVTATIIVALDALRHGIGL